MARLTSTWSTISHQTPAVPAGMNQIRQLNTTTATIARMKVFLLPIFSENGTAKATQYAKNVEIHNSVLNSKDSFWEAENIEIYDSVINGEYLAWYSKNVRLVRCHITETQPLCYCDGLVMEDCTFGSDCDLAFEYSEVEATVKGHVVSIKNPRTGHIHAGSIGEIIIDGNIKAPGNCVITQDE